MPNGSGGVGSLMPSWLNRCWAVAGRELSTPKSLSFEPVFIYQAPCSAAMLSDEISQAIFCIARFAKPSPNQLLDPLLCGWSCHRSNARVPPGFDFDIRRQTSDVDKAPGIHDCPFVEGGDSAGKRIDKSVKVSIRQRPIHVAIELGQVAWDVVCAQNHFQGAPSSHETRQLRHGATARHQTGANFKLRQDGFFATGKTHVAGKGKLTSHTSRPPANRRYRYDRSTTQAHQHLGPWMQPCGSRGKMRQIVKFCKKIQMNQKETFNGTIKNRHLNLLVSFDCRDDLVHLRKHLRTEDVERRMVKRDSPILGRALGQTYLSSLCGCVILIFHVVVSISFGFMFDFALRSSYEALWSRGFGEVVLHRETRVTDRCGALRCPP